jgi:hypothetical protein
MHTAAHSNTEGAHGAATVWGRQKGCKGALRQQQAMLVAPAALPVGTIGKEAHMPRPWEAVSISRGMVHQGLQAGDCGTTLATLAQMATEP